MRAVFLLVVAVISHVPGVARADAKACVSSHAAGKDLRKKGALIAAKEKFLECAEDACPKLVREECRDLVSKLASEIPSIVVVARDASGKDVTSGRVLLDGKEVDGALSGRSLSVDPGPHKLELVSGDGKKAELEFVARDGDKSRAIELALAAAAETPARAEEPDAAPRPPEARSSKAPVVAYVLAGVAAAAFGSFAYFALDGKAKKDDLDACKPACKQSNVDAMRRSFLIGDISLGVGVAALGGSAYFFLARSQPEAERSVARAPLFVGVRGRW